MGVSHLTNPLVQTGSCSSLKLNMLNHLFCNVPVARAGVTNLKISEMACLKGSNLEIRECRMWYVNDWPKAEVCIYTAHPLVSAFWTWIVGDFVYQLIVVTCGRQMTQCEMHVHSKNKASFHLFLSLPVCVIQTLRKCLWANSARCRLQRASKCWRRLRRP